MKGTIRDRDLVVFERRPSPRKRGTDEACGVCRIGDFGGDKSALLDRIDFGSVWAREAGELVEHLDGAALSKLVEQTVEAWTPLDDDLMYEVVLCFHAELAGHGSTAQAVRFRTAIAASSSSIYRGRLWAEGWSEAFSVEAIAAAFVEDRHPDFFYGLDEDQYQSIIESVVESAEGDAQTTSALLDAVLFASGPQQSYMHCLPLSRSNRIRLAKDLAHPERYKAAIQAVTATASPDVLLRLFLSGFLDSFDVEAVRSNARDLDRSELLLLLDHELSSEELKVDLLSVYTDQAVREEASHDVVEALAWAIKQSRKALSPKQAEDFEAVVLDGLSGAKRFELWEAGVVATYPEPYVRSVAAVLERARFARVLKASAHGTVKDLLDIRLEHALRGEERLDHIEWLWKLAVEHLEEGESEVFHHKTLDALSSGEHFALWERGLTEQYPEHIVRERVQELTRSQLDRIFATASLGFVEELLRARLSATVVESMTQGWVATIQELEWAFKAALAQLPLEVAKTLQDEPLRYLPDEAHFELWQCGAVSEVPTDIIRDRLRADAPATLRSAATWIQREILTRSKADQLVERSLATLPPVDTAEDFCTLCEHLDFLQNGLTEREAGPRDLVSLLGTLSLDERNDALARLHLWLAGRGLLDFDAFKTCVVYLSAKDQVRFLRKLFFLHQRGEFEITVSKLQEITRFDEDIYALARDYHGLHLDLSVEILIQTIFQVQAKGRFLLESNLLGLAYAGLAGDPTQPLALTDVGIFEKCRGRMTAEFNSKSTAGVITREEDGTRAFYRIQFDYNPHLVAAVKQQLLGRRYDPRSKTWTVPVEQEEAIRAFATEYRFEFDPEGGGFITANKHLFDFKRDLDRVPRGITYCEGQKAKQLHEFHDQRFWWCRGRPCFENCETKHSSEEWEDYTFLKLLDILGLDCDERETRTGELIPNGEYYKFVGTVNRFRRLCDHLKCCSCARVLFPVESSYYAHYRVTRFWCENEGCDKHHEEVYLHHCLNGLCDNIIDSRDTCQCPNGWWICKDGRCGCCCSNITSRSRQNNLHKAGGSVTSALEEQVTKAKGHLERHMAFCYRCGGEMDTKDCEHFQCECGISYERRLGRSRRRRLPPCPPASESSSDMDLPY